MVNSSPDLTVTTGAVTSRTKSTVVTLPATSRTSSLLVPSTAPKTLGLTPFRSDQVLSERSLTLPLSTIRSILPSSNSL